MERRQLLGFHIFKEIAMVKVYHQVYDHTVSESKSQERKPRIIKYLNWKGIRDIQRI